MVGRRTDRDNGEAEQHIAIFLTVRDLPDELAVMADLCELIDAMPADRLRTLRTILSVSTAPDCSTPSLPRRRISRRPLYRRDQGRSDIPQP